MKLQGLYIFYLQNQIKGGISRLAKSRKRPENRSLLL